MLGDGVVGETENFYVGVCLTTLIRQGCAGCIPRAGHDPMASARRPAYRRAMNKIFGFAGHAGLMSGAVLVAALTGCNKSPPDVQYVSAPAAAPAAPAPATVVQVQ